MTHPRSPSGERPGAAAGLRTAPGGRLCPSSLSAAQLTLSPLCSCAAIRQAIAKSLVAFYQKYVDEATKKEIKDILLSYDRTLLVADPRRCEPK